MSIEDRVVSIIARNIEKKKKDAVTLSSDLAADLGADSLAVLMIIQALEDEFGISIDDEDFKKIGTVRDIVDNLKTRYPAILEEK